MVGSVPIPLGLPSQSQLSPPPLSLFAPWLRLVDGSAVNAAPPSDFPIAVTSLPPFLPPPTIDLVAGPGFEMLRIDWFFYLPL